MDLHLTLALVQHAADAVGHLAPQARQPWRVTFRATAKPGLQTMGSPQLLPSPDHAAKPGAPTCHGLAIGEPAQQGAQPTPQQETGEVNEHASGHRRRGQAIARSAHGFDHLAGVAQRFTQAFDMYIHRTLFDVDVVTPDLVQQ